MAFSSRYTIFLSEPYWTKSSMALYLILCLLSCKAQHSRWVPCIEYVGWDRFGVMRQPHPPLTLGATITRSGSSNVRRSRTDGEDEDEMSTSSNMSASVETSESSEGQDEENMAFLYDGSDQVNEDAVDVEMATIGHSENLRHRGPVPTRTAASEMETSNNNNSTAGGGLGDGTQEGSATDTLSSLLPFLSSRNNASSSRDR